jgi:arsenite/tail-anchored protein-transporting ATPase
LIAESNDDTASTSNYPMAFAKLTLVVGKGGVGRTTVAEGLAMAASARGEHATCVQLGVASAKKHRQRAQHEKITWLSLDGTAALEAVAAPLFGSRRIAKSVLGNFAIARLLDVVPALREYALLTAALDLAASGVVVVDMPATGHGVAWLGVAGRLATLVPAGRTRDQALRVDAAMRDPRLTTIVAVTLLDKLVLAETHQLRSALQTELGRDIDHIVINRAPVVPDNSIQLAHELAASGSQQSDHFLQLASWLEQRQAALAAARQFAGDVDATWIDDYPGVPPAQAIAAVLARAA